MVVYSHGCDNPNWVAIDALTEDHAGCQSTWRRDADGAGTLPASAGCEPVAAPVRLSASPYASVPRKTRVASRKKGPEIVIVASSKKGPEIFSLI